MSQPRDEPPPASEPEVRERYTARMERSRQALALLRRRSRRMAHLRFVTFLGAATAIGYGFWNLADIRWGAVLGGVVGFIGFVVLVLAHDRILREVTRYEVLSDLCREALHRLDRAWDRLPDRAAPGAAARDPVAQDLDLFEGAGRRASLFGLLGTAHTPMGRQTLATWLLTPETPATIRERQAAVRELAPQLDFRQELALRGRKMLTLPPDVEPFLQWAEGEPWLLARAWRLWLPRALAGGTLALMALNIAGLLPPWWLVAAMVNLVVSGVMSRAAHQIFDQVAWRERAFRHFAGLFAPLSEARFEAARLRALQERLHTQGLAAHRQMKRLDSIIGYADARRSGILYLVLQGLTLWDFHVLYFLERWQARVGRHVRDWFAVLGELEALGALAALHHDHPGWAFPEVDAGADRLEAEDLGHPLLPGDACVTNPVVLGPAGAFLLVTGSNMSGKSTLLRAIGANVVLAQAGGPVRASRLRMPPVRLGTSFRVQDSLEAGVSFFMAELRRLKDLMDQARECRDDPAWTTLYLLDEILQGTNVYERQIAVRRVIQYLMAQGALGAVSTHDLTLADADGLSDAAHPVHFTEDYRVTDEGPRMTFDYQLREGVAPTTNALKLLELVGLPSE